MSADFRCFVENYKAMKIKGRYEIEFDRKDWWCIIILLVLVVGLVVNSAPVNNFLEEFLKRWDAR